MSYGTEQPLSEAGLRICRVVSEQPGIHFRGLARAATLPAGQLRHHLDRLVRRGILVELEDGGYKRFFLAGKHDPRLRPALALFARRVPRRIGSLLLLRPMTRTELRRHLGCGDSTLGFHLARMVQAQVVTKQRDRSGCRYALGEPELARQALAMRAAAANQEERAAQQRELEQAQRDGWSPLAPRDSLLPPRRAAEPPIPMMALEGHLPPATEGPEGLSPVPRTIPGPASAATESRSVGADDEVEDGAVPPSLDEAEEAEEIEVETSSTSPGASGTSDRPADPRRDLFLREAR